MAKRDWGKSGFVGGLDFGPSRPDQPKGERIVEHPWGPIVRAVDAAGYRDASRGSARLYWIHVGLECQREGADTGYKAMSPALVGVKPQPPKIPRHS